MNAKTILAIFFIAGSIAIVSTTSMTTVAFPDKSSGENGLNKADDNIHDNTPGGFAGHQDIVHHEGTCHGRHDVHIPDGCDNPLITDPGKSDDKRQNPNNN